MKKYESQEPGVKAHLHLLSLQKAVYMSLKRDKELAQIIQFDKEIPGGTYKRAWEIVEAEGYDLFLKEF